MTHAQHAPASPDQSRHVPDASNASDPRSHRAEAAMNEPGPGSSAHGLDGIDVDLTPDTLFVPAGATVEGDVIAGPQVARIVVAGRVTGRVAAATQPVAIMAGAVVCGHVVSDGAVIVAGEVQGYDARGVSVRTAADCVLAEGGVIAGDVEYKTTLCWYEGGMIHGRMLPYSNAQQAG